MEEEKVKNGPIWEKTGFWSWFTRRVSGMFTTVLLQWFYQNCSNCVPGRTFHWGFMWTHRPAVIFVQFQMGSLKGTWFEEVKWGRQKKEGDPGWVSVPLEREGGA